MTKVKKRCLGRILGIVVGLSLVFFALSQLSYRYPFIPSILIGIGVILLMLSYGKGRRKKLGGVLTTKGKKESSNDQKGNYNPRRNISQYGNKTDGDIDLEQNPDANENPTCIPHRIPPREKS